jgi:hypothetical protein
MRALAMVAEVVVTPGSNPDRARSFVATRSADTYRELIRCNRMPPSALQRRSYRTAERVHDAWREALAPVGAGLRSAAAPASSCLDNGGLTDSGACLRLGDRIGLR